MKRVLLALAILSGTLACSDIEDALARRRDGGSGGGSGGGFGGGFGGGTGGGFDGGTGGGSGGGRTDAGPFIPPSDGGPICLDGFCWENPLPQGNPLTAVWAVDPREDVFMVGEVGMVLRWKAGTWYSYQSRFPQNQTLNSVWGAGNKLWVVGTAEGTLTMNPMRFDLPNGPWVEEHWSGFGSMLLSVRGKNENEVFAVGQSGVFGRREPDGGWQSWQYFGGNANIDAIAFDSTGDCRIAVRGGYAGVGVCDGGSLELTIDDAFGEIGNNALWSPSPGVFYAAGGSRTEIGQVFSNAGGGWTQIYSGDKNCSAAAGLGPVNIAACSPTVVRTLPDGNSASSGLSGNESFGGAWSGGQLETSWLVGVGGVAWYHNGGGWFPQHSGLRQTVHTIVAAPGGSAFAGGSNSVFWTRNPALGTWDVRTLTSEGSDTNAIWFSPDGTWLAYAGSSHVLYEGPTMNTLAQAQGVPIDSAKQFNALWGNWRGDLWAVGNGGEVWHHLDAGWAQEQLMPDGGTPDFTSIDGRPNGTAFIVGEACQVLVRESDGGWHPELVQNPASCAGDLNGVWAVPFNGVGLEAVAVGPKQTLYMRTSGVWSPVSVTAPYNLNAVWGVSEFKMFAVGDHGTLLVFNGANWFPTETGTRNDLTTVHGEVLEDGGVELFIGGGYGTILHKRF